MKLLFQPGETRQYTRTVQPDDAARFENGLVHPVYATFALARDAEWCCRLFVLEMKEESEEGIGTMVSVNHRSPALVGQNVDFTATVKSIRGNELVCGYEARVGERLIADGEQIQKILPKEKITRLFDSLR